MDEANRNHAPALGRPLEEALHPVVVVRVLVRHDDDVALPERQLVLVVGLAVVEGPTAAMHQAREARRRCRRLKKQVRGTSVITRSIESLYISVALSSLSAVGVFRLAYYRASDWERGCFNDGLA